MSMSFAPGGALAFPRRWTQALRPLRWQSCLGTLLPLVALCATLVTVAVTRPRMPIVAEAPPAVTPVRIDPWVEIAKPFRLFDLPAPLFNREPSAYEARRHRTGGGREDILTFNSFGGEAPWLRLAIYRAGAEGLPDSNFFVAMVRTASRAGLAVTRSGQADEIPTRFGAMEIADVQLSRGVAMQACLGYRLTSRDPDLQMAGLACGTAQQPMDRRGLVCILDRLDLLAAGEDSNLTDFFAKAEFLRGTGCKTVASAEPEPMPDAEKAAAPARKHGRAARRHLRGGKAPARR